MPSLVHKFNIKMPSKGVIHVKAFITKVEINLETNSNIPVNVGSLNTKVKVNKNEISASGSLEAAINKNIKASVTAGLNLSSKKIIDILKKIAEKGSCTPNSFTPLISDLGTSLGCNFVTVSLGWDSDLCFLSLQGKIPIKVENQTITPNVKIKLGFSESTWVRLLALTVKGAPAPPSYITKFESIFVSLFGRIRAVPKLFALRAAFAAMEKVSPYLWAIDIALTIRNLTLWMAKRERLKGYKSGLLTSFGTAFSQIIFNYPLRFETGDVAIAQTLAAEYAAKYHGENRVAVQRYLSLYYYSAQRITSSSEAHTVGMYLANGINSRSGGAPPTNFRRPGTSTSRITSPMNRSEEIVYQHIYRQIDSYFLINIDRWVSEWKTQPKKKKQN